MSKKNIEGSVINIFEQILEIEDGSVKREQTLEELEVDSILFIRLVVQCETEFNIQFEDEMLLITKFPDVDTYVKYVQSRYEASDSGETESI